MLHMSRQAFAPLIAYEAVAISPLGPIERQVVYLSLGDDRRSAIGETRMRRLWRVLFAPRGANRLADPQLEALRVFCVLYRHDRSVIDQKLFVNGGREHFVDPATMSAAAEVIDHALPGRSQPTLPLRAGPPPYFPNYLDGP